jgi:hypothetical protein
VRVEEVIESLVKGSKFSDNGLILPNSTNEYEWKKIGLELSRYEKTLTWWVADWLAFGELKYGDLKAIVESPHWHGPGYGACRNATCVARAFRLSRRRDKLSFSHHREVAALPEDEADRVLDWAEEPSHSWRNKAS